MSEKKVCKQKLSIALGITIVILLAGLAGIVITYTSIINEKDSIIATKDSQIQTLTNQMIQLQAWLDGNKTEFEQQIQQLQQKMLQVEQETL